MKRVRRDGGDVKYAGSPGGRLQIRLRLEVRSPIGGVL